MNHNKTEAICNDCWFRVFEQRLPPRTNTPEECSKCGQSKPCGQYSVFYVMERLFEAAREKGLSLEDFVMSMPRPNRNLAEIEN